MDDFSKSFEIIWWRVLFENSGLYIDNSIFRDYLCDHIEFNSLDGNPSPHIYYMIISYFSFSNSICLYTWIFKASKLQSLSSIQRGKIKKELFLLEKDIIDAENTNDTSVIKQINHAKFLLQQIDESINFNELIHKATKVMGYPATQNVISSTLGIILTGFVLAVEGFSGSDIVYDSMGWFNY